MKYEDLLYLDGFAGYGGFRHAFEKAGWKFKKVWFSEIDKYAIANYKYNFRNSEYAGSITDVSGLPKLDLFTFGWPCQDNSIAGKRQGQKSGTRSGLLFSAISCIERFRPRNFVAENVKGLQSVNGGIDIIESLKVLSYLNDSLPQYDIEMQLLNTRWFLPQNRERLFFVGHLRTKGKGTKKIFPIGESTIEGREPYKEKASDPGVTLICDSMQGRKLEERKIMQTMRSNTSGGHGNYIKYGNSQDQKISTEVSQCLSAGHFNVPKVIITDNLYSSRIRDYEDEAPTLTSNLAGRLKVNKIRRLTPVECERLQGLPDNWTQTGIINGSFVNISDTHRYHLCGNGVSIPVVQAIAEKLKQSTC